MIQTERLFIMPATLPMLEAVADENWAELSSLLGGVYIADKWTHFPEALVWMRDYLRANPAETGWWSYLIVHGIDGRLIGTCGYKGAPSPEGVVEAGYEIADSYQNQGLATEAMGGLVAHAFKSSQVTAVTAHTLAQENASVKVLRKLGFEFTGESFDLNDGPIWGWRKTKTYA